METNVIIEAGEEQSCFTVEIIPDESFEKNEYFTVIITDAEEDVHVYTENVTVHIEDDDSKSFVSLLSVLPRGIRPKKHTQKKTLYGRGGGGGGSHPNPHTLIL